MVGWQARAKVTTMTPAAARIADVVHDGLEWMRPHTQAFPWDERSAYADWLSQTYHYVHRSTRLLACAAARFPVDQRGDALHHRFSRHMSEEKKHERLCLHDIGCLGAALIDYPERPATRMLYEPQYFKIEHQDPTAVFGYILVLEALGAVDGRAIHEAVVRAHGDPCASFVMLHASEDPDHLTKAYAILEGCSPAQLALVEENAWQTVHAYAGMLREIRENLRRGA
jgi:hypothetical protein